MSLILKDLYRRGGCGTEKRGIKKNEGSSHYVIENKYRKNVDLRVSHHIYENKRLISLNPSYI
jgi:hypothetical protein